MVHRGAEMWNIRRVHKLLTWIVKTAYVQSKFGFWNPNWRTILQEISEICDVQNPYSDASLSLIPWKRKKLKLEPKSDTDKKIWLDFRIVPFYWLIIRDINPNSGKIKDSVTSFDMFWFEIPKLVECYSLCHSEEEEIFLPYAIK